MVPSEVPESQQVQGPICLVISVSVPLPLLLASVTKHLRKSCSQKPESFLTSPSPSSPRAPHPPDLSPYLLSILRPSACFHLSCLVPAAIMCLLGDCSSPSVHLSAFLSAPPIPSLKNAHPVQSLFCSMFNEEPSASCSCQLSSLVSCHNYLHFSCSILSPQSANLALWMATLNIACSAWSPAAPLPG